MEATTGRVGRVREHAKVALRNSLYRHNYNLSRDPFIARIARMLDTRDLTCVLDIGANIGQYGQALRACGFAGDIVSCEPLTDAYGHLARRTARDRRWTALHTGVGAEAGDLEINISANSYSSSMRTMTSTHQDADPASRVISTERVSMTTVAALIADRGIQPERTFLKVDTQGFESEVLDGAGDALTSFAAVQLELSLTPLYEGQALDDVLVQRMTDNGLTLFCFDAGIADPRTGRLLQWDGLFVRD